MNASWQSRLLQRLNEKTLPAGPVCPLCGHKQFTLLDGMMNPAIPTDFQPNVVRLGGPSLPLVVLACNHCGWTAQIAVRVLDPEFPLDNPAASSSPAPTPPPLSQANGQ